MISEAGIVHKVATHLQRQCHMQAMPRPGRVAASDDDKELEAALERSLVEHASLAPGSSPPLPQHGVSFANMTKMGYAASGKPSFISYANEQFLFLSVLQQD